MNTRQISKILHDNDFVHESGTPEELKVAEYIMARCEEMGVKPHLEGFEVDMADVTFSKLTADGVDIPCEGFRLCGSGEVEAPFLYMPSTDPDSIAKAKGKIVLLDSGLTHFVFQDLYAAGVAGIITYPGNVFWRDNDIDHKELRGYVSLGKKKLAVNINAKSAAKLVRMNPKTVKISVKQDEFKGESHNGVAEIPGESDEFIVLSAHYDTTYLSHGSYDNLTGSIGLLGIMDELRNNKDLALLEFQAPQPSLDGFTDELLDDDDIAMKLIENEDITWMFYKMSERIKRKYLDKLPERTRQNIKEELHIE